MDEFDGWAGATTEADHASAVQYLAQPLERASFRDMKPNGDVLLMEEILSSGVPFFEDKMHESEREYGYPLLLYVSLVILHLFRENRAAGVDALLAYPVVFTQVVRYASSIGDSELHAAVGEYLRATTPLWKDEELRTLAALAGCALDALRTARELALCVQALAASPRIDDGYSFWNSGPLASSRGLMVGDFHRVAAALREAAESTARFATRIDPKNQDGP